MKTDSMTTPPPESSPVTRANTPVIINKARILHEHIYIIGGKLSKRDKLGIHRQIEDQVLKLFSLLVEAAFAARLYKQKILERARIDVEIIKHLVRTEESLKIIDDRWYMKISSELIEISKMLNGWIGYLNEKHTR